MTNKKYDFYSDTHLYIHFYNNIKSISNENEFILIKETIIKKKEKYEVLFNIINKIEKNLSNKTESKIIFISNAGLTLISPWFPMLFKRLGYLDKDGKFKDVSTKIRAIFVLQYILFEDDDIAFKESDLSLNRILTASPFYVPLPQKLTLTDKEKNTVHEMLLGIKANWDKIKNTSLNGFKESFLKRSGRIEIDKEKNCIIYVDNKSYDMLLDSLPWSYKLIRYSWLKKIITVQWK
ncbi:MAG: hypothetical protein IMY73_00610 [Bacteroidetes bacterium]|nr:hypothetical protein [Bacteroidota bacterium]